MSTNHNRIKVADLEINQRDKILTTNSSGELEFSDINNIKTSSYNGLDYNQEGKVLDARQGKVLKDLIDNANDLLSSDNINLNTLQKLADAIEELRSSLSITLVNDLNTGGTTKALTAEMGKVLNTRLLEIESKVIPNLNALNVALGSYPSTRNDGQLPNNKVLSTDANGNIKLYTITTTPAPFLEVLAPDSTLPSTTTNITLKGAFFTPNMSVTISGQTVNYVSFVNDNLVTVNITTGSAEGLFDITLNNGLSATFKNAFMTVLGTIYTPLTAEWTSHTGAITAGDGKIETLSYTSVGSVIWNRELDWTKNFEIRCKPRKSPFGVPTGYQYSFLQLLNVSDNTNKLNLAWTYPVGYVECRTSFDYEIYSAPIAPSANSSLEAWNTYIEDIEIKIRWFDGIFTLWHNGQLKKTFSSGLTENLKLKASVYSTDLYDIKYIELAS